MTAGVVDFNPLRDKSYQSTGLGKPIVDHLARKRNQGRSDRTLDDKERYLASLALTFPNKTLADLTVFDIDHWIALQPAASRRHRASHINTFLGWAVRWELIDRNPMDKLDPISRPGQKVYDIFTEPECTALCSLPLLDGALMQILIDGGLRRSEGIDFRLGHYRPISTLNAPHGELAIFAGKGAKDRVLPATATIEQKLNELAVMEGVGQDDHLWYTRRKNPYWGERIQRSKPMGNTSFNRWWDRAIDAAGVRRRNPHMTRHTFATRWLRRGGRLETLSLAMGHASIRTTFDLYGHLDTRDVGPRHPLDRSKRIGACEKCPFKKPRFAGMKAPSGIEPLYGALQAPA